MVHTKVQTPQGMRDFLPRDFSRMSWLESVVRETVKRWGYREISTPTFEYLDVVAAGSRPGRRKSMFVFFDREGDTLSLRYDATTPIARVAGTRLSGGPKPIRLSYVESIFRNDEPEAGRRREFCQAGIELIGASGPDADAEVVAVAVETMEKVGLAGFQVDIGHVEYAGGILASDGLSDETALEIKSALLRRDEVGLAEIVRSTNMPEEVRGALLALPELRGGAEVIEAARKWAQGDRSRKALDDLAAILEACESHGIADRVSIDLGLVKDLDYYTGMVLEGYTRDLGFAICTGGRYDNLIGEFGAGMPATGFAMVMDRLLDALERQGYEFEEEAGPEVLVTWPKMVTENGTSGQVWDDASAGARRRAGQFARNLRAKGVVVELDVAARPLGQTLSYARSMGIDAVVVFSRENGEEVQVYHWSDELVPKGGPFDAGEAMAGDAGYKVSRRRADDLARELAKCARSQF